MVEVILRTLAVVVSLMWSSSVGALEPPKGWAATATRIVATLEGGRTVHWANVTSDFDCQGLSLGILQWTVGTGSLRRMLDRVPPVELEQIVREIFAEDAPQFVAIIGADTGLALKAARDWQLPNFTPVENAKCREKGQRSGARLKDPRLREKLGRFLINETVLAAQRQQLNQDVLCAYELAIVWRVAVERHPGRDRNFVPCSGAPLKVTAEPSFQEFLFFLDLKTQNGGRLIKDLIELAASLSDISGQDDRDLLNHNFMMATSWMSACWEWAHALPCRRHFNRADWRDAKVNTQSWRRMTKGSQVESNRLKLFVLAFVRSTLAKRQWSVNVMNRKGTIVFGLGCVNGMTIDLRDLVPELEAPFSGIRNGCILKSNQ